jgi:hypothetical protein
MKTVFRVAALALAVAAVARVIYRRRARSLGL